MLFRSPPIVLKEPKPTERNTEPTSPPVGNESKPTEPKTIPLTTNPVNEQPVTSSDDKNKIEIQPQVRSESKTRDNTPPPNNFSIGDEKGILKFNTAQGFIPLGDYDPMGKTIIFKGMVINESITPFEFTDINNNPIRQQDLIGKIVVLNFWATWCSPCKPTIEYTQRLANKYNDKDVVFLYVSADSDVATWKEYLKEHPIKGIQGLDDNRLLRINLRVQGVPNYFIVDKKGRIAYNSIIQSKMNAEEMIEFLLKSP